MSDDPCDDGIDVDETLLALALRENSENELLIELCDFYEKEYYCLHCKKLRKPLRNLPAKICRRCGSHLVKVYTEEV
jgi:hypothetical protein